MMILKGLGPWVKLSPYQAGRANDQSRTVSQIQELSTRINRLETFEIYTVEKVKKRLSALVN
jgi:hypothetical protein